jgi:hypothetical protein
MDVGVCCGKLTFLCCLLYKFVFVACFGGSPFGEAAKTGII